MVADNLDVAGVSLASPLEAAARAILCDRLKDVTRRVKRCRGRAVERAEKVHSLRSSIRRAVAALDLFSPALDQDRLEKVRSELERIRRSAGHVRDCDVLMGLLGEIGREAGGDDADTAADSARQLAEHRIEACGKLQRRCERSPAIRTGWLLRDDGPCGLTLDLAAAAAETDLRRAIEDGMKQDLSDATCLHEVRILLRQLRYTLEMSHPDDARIPALKSVLNVLGEVADLTRLVERLTDDRAERKSKGRRAIDSLLKCCRGRRERRERAARKVLEQAPWLPGGGSSRMLRGEMASHQLVGETSAA